MPVLLTFVEIGSIHQSKQKKYISSAAVNNHDALAIKAIGETLGLIGAIEGLDFRGDGPLVDVWIY